MISDGRVRGAEGSGDLHARLSALVQARATSEGRTASALPGLWFFRYERPRPPVRSRSQTMYAAVAVQGAKRVRAGELDFVYGARRCLVVRGDTAFEATVVEASPERPYLAVGVELPPDLVVSTMLDLFDGGDVRTEPARPACAARLTTPLVDAMCRLVAALDDEAERRVLAPLALREIVFRLLSTEACAVMRTAGEDGGSGARIRQAMAFLERNAARRLSVAAVARHVAMSPSHFAHRFREVASMSPMQFLKRARLARARELLLAEGLRPSEVAARVGYANASHFSRDFKRHFGLSPARYAGAFDGRSTVHLGAGGVPA